MRNILLIVLFLISWSCAQEKKEGPVVKTGVDIIALGSVNYGGVLIGGSKDAAVKLVNNDAKSVDLNFDFPAPFSLVSTSVSCSGGKLPPLGECIVSIRFTPTEEGVFDLELKIGETSLAIKGVGLQDGYVTIDTNRWLIGTTTAGILRTKDITFNNLGDLTVQTPVFNLPPYIKIGFNRCGNFMTARSSCVIRFETELKTAQEYDVDIIGQSEDAGTVMFNFTASVEPAEPAGLITFLKFPTKMDSAGSEFELETNPVRDSFGNVVKAGTTINTSVNNLLILLDAVNGNTFHTDANGIVKFRVRTRTQKGSGAVSLMSGQSSGFIGFPITSGEAFGEIRIPSVLTEILANGQTQVVLNTEVIYDQYNNIVEDGTEIIFELEGDGQISTGANPKRRLSYTINGIASITLKAGITAQTAVLRAFSSPIIDQNQGVVVGYRANGSLNLNFVPGPADGHIPVFSAVPAIYSNTNPPADIIPLPTKTRITIGPVKDKFQNVVKKNYEILVVIDKGFNSSAAVPENFSRLYTDQDGYATFELIGDSKRGDIKVTATAALAEGSTSVWGFLKTNNQYLANTNNVSLYFKHASSQTIPLATEYWAQVQRAEAISLMDNYYYGLEKVNDSPVISDVRMPYFTWKCFYPALENIVGNFCLQGNGEFSPLLVYGPKHEVSYDFPIDNPHAELSPNTTFSAANKLIGWSYHKENSDSMPLWVASANPTDGALLINNLVALTQEEKYEGKRKRQAYSNWITVDDLKKYVLTYEVKQQLGNDDNRHLEVGVFETELTDPAQLNNTAWDFAEDVRILQKEVVIPIPTVPENYRILYVPTPGTKRIRLYFSTKGRGGQAYVVYDNISLKETDAQNIHDGMVTEGPSIAYLPKFDQGIMFGGSTMEDLSGMYRPAVSNRITLLNYVLNKGTPVSVENINPDTAGSIYGEIPEERAHAPITTVGQDLAYIFGGFDPSSLSAFGDTYKYDSNDRIWTKIQTHPDLTVPGALQDPNKGKPSSRYQHSFNYVPELNRIYLFGGLSATDPEDQTVWTKNDDIWYLDLNEDNKYAWKRVCGNCNLFTSATYINLAGSIMTLAEFPTQASLQNYVIAQRKLTNLSVIWHSASQLFYLHLPETSFMKTFNPFSEVIGDPQNKGIKEMSDGFQLVYNPNIGRTFSYKRGTVGMENSFFRIWDMNIDEKQYLKVKFALSPMAKQHMQEFAVKLYSYGMSKTTRIGGDTLTRGVNAYIYNFTMNRWDLLGGHSVNTAEEVPEIIKKINNNTVKDYVSDNGDVEVLVSAKGRPGIDGGADLMGEELEYVNVGVDYQGNLEPIKQVVTSEKASCVLMENSDLKCWGANDSGILGHNLQYSAYGYAEGQLGNNTPITRLFNPNLPENFGLKIEKIFMGKNHACAIFNNFKAKCWGKNDYSQLGYEDFKDRGREHFVGESLPYLNVGTVDGTTNTINSRIIDLALGDEFTCAIVEANSLPNSNPSSVYSLQNRVKCWGRFNYGQVGIASPSNSINAATVPTNVSEKALQLRGNSSTFVSMPTDFDPILDAIREKRVVSLKAGKTHACASLEDKTIACWGDNRYGQLGVNSTTQSYVPVQIIFPYTNLNNMSIHSIELGGETSCMIFKPELSNNKIKCWGRNQFGQLGLGDVINRGTSSSIMGSLLETNLPSGFIPDKVTVGEKNVCIVSTQGRLICFGDNSEGQLGYGYSVLQAGHNSSSVGENARYVDVGTVSGGGGAPIEIKSIVSYYNHNCLLTTEGQMKCFGENGFGQLGYEDEFNRGRGQDPGVGTNDVKLDFIQLETVF